MRFSQDATSTSYWNLSEPPGCRALDESVARRACAPYGARGVDAVPILGGPPPLCFIGAP